MFSNALTLVVSCRIAQNAGRKSSEMQTIEHPAGRLTMQDRRVLVGRDHAASAFQSRDAFRERTNSFI